MNGGTRLATTSKACARPERRPSAARSGPASAAAVPLWGLSPAAASIHAAPDGVLRRKACACGGSCPRCLDDIQAKLLVGPVDDPYEREADHVASELLGLPGVPPHPSPPPELPQPAQPGPEPTAAALASGGSPLAPGLRSFFEERMGRDLSAVRIHAGTESQAFTDHLDAHAFTLGHHVWLGRGHAPAADFLLAHELVHVVQQRQPRFLRAATAHQADPAPAPLEALQGPAGIVNRFERALFWIPLGDVGKLKGADIHELLLDESQAANKQLDDEAPAPNADAQGWGLGHKGKIDLYQGSNGKRHHVMPGITFRNAQNIPVGSASDDPFAAVPEKHFQAAKKAAKATIAPRLEGSRITDLAAGPTDVKLGELKPAAAEILDKGEIQLNNYRQGMAHAARLANASVKLTVRAPAKPPTWDLKPPGVLDDADVKFKPEHTPPPPGQQPIGNLNLILGKVGENTKPVGEKYPVSTVFNPAARGLPPIKGGLFAKKSSKPGVWMYFARPNNLNDALTGARGNRRVQGDMVLANLIQDQVVTPLLTAPEKVKALSRRSRPAAEDPRVRRKPRPSPKLKETFKLTAWKQHQESLRKDVHPMTDPAKTNLAALEFLHLAYAAEESLDAVQGTGKTTLPPKSSDLVKTGTDPKHARNRPLADLSPWLQGWTGRPASALGVLRDTFGDTFVFAANKFIEIRETVRKKVKAFLDRRHKSLGSGMAAMVTKAIGRGLKAVLQVTLHQTAHYIVNRVEAGIKKKLSAWFDFDPAKLLEDKFEQTFGEYLEPLRELKKKVQGFFDDVVKGVAENFQWIEDLQKLASKVGPIIEGAVIALQCLTPPGWGCLKMLARKLQNWAIQKVLDMCDVKEAIAGLVAKAPFLNNISKSLGDKALQLMKTAAPPAFQDVFEAEADLPAPDAVACDDDLDPDEPPPVQGGTTGAGEHAETFREMQALKQEQGEEGTKAVIDLVSASGVPDAAPLTADQVRALRDKLRQTGASAQQLKDLAQGKAAEEAKKKLQPLKDYLDSIAVKERQGLLDQIASDLRAGKYEQELKKLAANKRTWLFVKPPALGEPFTGARVLMVAGDVRAGGLVDGAVGPCGPRGEAEIAIARADLRNADHPDQAVVVNTPLKGTIAGLCDVPPAVAQKPKPAQGEAEAGQRRAEASGGAAGSGGPTKAGTSVAGGGKPSGQATVLDVLRSGPGGGSGGAGAFDGFFDFCTDKLRCPAAATQVNFEAEDEKSLGLRVVLDSLRRGGGSAGSLQRARNARGPLVLKDNGDGSFNVLMLDLDGAEHFVGKAAASSDKPGEFEVKSGAILSQFRAAAKKWEKRYGIPGSQSRSHRFRI